MVLGRLHLSGDKNPKKVDIACIKYLYEQKTVLIPVREKQSLQSYRWAGNNRVLLSIGETVPFYNDEIFATRLISYDLTTKESRIVGKSAETIIGDDIIYNDPDGQFVLLSMQPDI